MNLQTANNILLQAYQSGAIAYPRVENDYTKTSLYSYFPHPSLNALNEFTTPLNKQEYQPIIENIHLELFNQGFYITPATVMKNYKYMKVFFNEDLSIKDSSIINRYDNAIDNFLDVEELEDKFLSKNMIELASNKPKTMKFSLKLEDTLKAKIAKKRVIDSPNRLKGADSLEELIDNFKNYKKAKQKEFKILTDIRELNEEFKSNKKIKIA